MKKSKRCCCGGDCREMCSRVIRMVLIGVGVILAGVLIHRLVTKNKKTFKPDREKEFPGTNEYTDTDVMVMGGAQPFDETGSVSPKKSTRRRSKG